jgi:ABC-type Na+ efflux pump permease subunit
MLDGLNSPPPYRWVNPPAELEAGNEEPLAGHFPLGLTKRGSAAGAFSTNDGQATLVISQGSIAPKEGEESLEVDVKPLDPATLDARLPDGLEITGNVYEFTAVYKPSGDAVTDLAGGGDQRALLIYPAEAGKHRPHTLVTSVDGRAWTKLDTEDSSGQQQVQAPVTSLGYIAVAAPPEESGGVSTSAIGVIVLAVVLLVLGALVIARNVRRPPSNRSSRRGRT